MRGRRPVIWMLSAVCLTGSDAHANMISLDATGKGSYAYTRLSGSTFINPSDAFAAALDGGATPESVASESRAWMSFDLSGITDDIYSARLRLRAGSLVSVLNSAPSDPLRPIQFRLFDVTTPAQTVADRTGDFASIFSDLGAGNVLGERLFMPGLDNNQFVELAINVQGLAAIEAMRGSQFVVGGAVSFIANRFPLILFDGETTPQLVVGVPEPPTMTLLGLAVLAGAFVLAMASTRRTFRGSAVAR